VPDLLTHLRRFVSLKFMKTTTCQRLVSVLTVLLAIVALAANAVGDEKTYAERLGWPAGAKVVIFHIDDAGMSHDSNAGVVEALERGVATSTSIMFPCPWATEIVRYVKEHPTVDAGVHVTLTSEWKNYRWGPVAGAKLVPGLTDAEGCLWSNVLQAATSAKVDEEESEIRAQVARCQKMGITPTHLDSHMGTVFATPALLERYIKIGVDTGIPVMLPAGHMQFIAGKTSLVPFPLQQLARHYGEKVWAAGLPVLDDLHTGGGVRKPEEKKQQILDFLRTMKPGLTQFIVHCTRPGDTFKFISSSGPMRQAELEAMLAPEVKQAIQEQKILLTTWRELKQRRDAVKNKG